MGGTGKVTVIADADTERALRVAQVLRGSPFGVCRRASTFLEYADLLSDVMVGAVVYCGVNTAISAVDAEHLLRLHHPGARFFHLFATYVEDDREREALHHEELEKLAEILAIWGPCGTSTSTCSSPHDESERLHAFSRQLPVAVLEFNGQASLVHANPAAIRLVRDLGLKLSEVWRILPPTLADMIVHRVTLPVFQTIYNGHTIIWNFGQDPPRELVHAYASDVTTYVRAKAELDESEANFRNLIESLSDAVVRISPKHMIEYISPHWARILGHSAESAMATPFLFWVEPEDASQVEAYLDSLFAGQKQPNPVIFRARHSDSSIRWLSASGSVIGSGTPDNEFVALLVRDITDVQNLEEQLRQSQKMEAVGLLAGGIAHDFNNLLTGVMGYLDLALMQIEPSSLVFNDLKQAQTYSERAAGLTRQLLAFSRHQRIEPRPLSLNDVICSLASSLQRSIGQTIEIEIDLEPELQSVVADQGQIEQLVTNLTINAKDAMPDGGHLKLSTLNVSLEEQFARRQIGVEAGDFVVLEALDTSHGWTDERRERVFDPFYVSSKLKTSGLGLAIAYGIVKQHHGAISVSYRPDKGRAFRAYLPASECRRSVPARKDAARPATLLIVEEEKSVRDFATRTLRQNGYQVLTAESPDDAKKLINACGSNIELLITEIAFWMDAQFDLRSWLKQYYSHIKVLCMSSRSTSQLRDPSLRVEPDSFLQKPFSAQTLLHKVSTILAEELKPVKDSNLEPRT